MDSVDKLGRVADRRCVASSRSDHADLLVAEPILEPQNSPDSRTFSAF